ncbi:hypothetical protein OSB04_008693 [Centaurea solstitialis]|uniref:BHLH domain-containing protein n=1 Tax=Centaurea solstitialis TaxID=347529 RepID=A0AA38TMB6_9ASTR|nr:hypothetical protein OSB04_008693 [Centaurea solstitialis]
MMDNNSDTFETSDCFDPIPIPIPIPNPATHTHQLQIDHGDVSNFHQIPNFAIEDELHHHQNHHLVNQQQLNWTTHNDHQILNNDDCLPNQPPPDLLNFFQLPPNCSSSAMYDPLMPLNQQPPFFRELLNSLPNGFNFGGCGSILGEMDVETGDEGRLYHENDSILEFGGGIVNGKGKDTKSEKHRRQQFNGKFEALKELVPNPAKADRASLVGYAIEYINELKRTVEKLKILVEKKRCGRSRIKRRKPEEDSTLDVESIYTRSNGDHQQTVNGDSSSTMRSSWLQRKSKNTEIDVRIIDDEVTIKLVHEKKMNCLLIVSKVLDEFQLDLHHVAGGVIGDFYSYLFNSKICEGSFVYASAIANKVIEVVDKQYAT